MTLYSSVTGDADGSTVVFLHGLGVSSWMWADLVAALREDHRCVVVDLPGCGRSAGRPWQSLEASAVQVATLVRDAAKTGRAHVVGLSLGGYVALQLLADHPDVVASAIASGVTTTPLTPAWRYRLLFRLSGMLTRLRPVVAASARAMRLTPEERELYRRDMAALAPSTTRAIYGELLDFAIPDACAAGADRLLMVAGEREVAAISTDLGGVDDQLPGVTAAVVPGARHAWVGEQPQLFTAMVREWVAARRLADGLLPAEDWSGTVRAGG